MSISILCGNVGIDDFPVSYKQKESGLCVNNMNEINKQTYGKNKKPKTDYFGCAQTFTAEFTCPYISNLLDKADVYVFSELCNYDYMNKNKLFTYGGGQYYHVHVETKVKIYNDNYTNLHKQIINNFKLLLTNSITNIETNMDNVDAIDTNNDITKQFVSQVRSVPGSFVKNLESLKQLLKNIDTFKIRFNNDSETLSTAIEKSASLLKNTYSKLLSNYIIANNKDVMSKDELATNNKKLFFTGSNMYVIKNVDENLRVIDNPSLNYVLPNPDYKNDYDLTRVEFNTGSLFIINVHQRTSDNKFYDNVKKLSENIKGNLIIVGDFNDTIPELKGRVESHAEFVKYLSNNGFVEADVKSVYDKMSSCRMGKKSQNMHLFYRLDDFNVKSVDPVQVNNMCEFGTPTSSHYPFILRIDPKVDKAVVENKELWEKVKSECVNDIEGKEKKISDLERKISDYDLEIKEYSSDRNKYDVMKKGFDDYRKNTDSELNDISKKYSESSHNLDDISKKYSESSHNLESVKRNLGECSNNSVKKDDEIKVLKSEVEKYEVLKKKYDELEKEKKLLEQGKVKLNEKKPILQSLVDKVMGTIDNSAKIDELKMDIDNKEHQIRKLERLVKEFGKTLESKENACVSEKNKLELSISNMITDNINLKGKIDKMSSDVKKQEDVIKSNKTEMEKMGKAISNANKGEATYDKLIKKMEERIDSLKKDNDKAHINIGELKKNIGVCEKDFTSNKEKTDRLKKIITELR